MSGTSQNKRFRIVHYLNQFFGGVGGEEQADCEPRTIQGSKGPGRLFEKFFREQNLPVAIAAMYKENPGVDQYRKTAFIVECADLVTGMEDAVQKMVRLGKKVLQGEKIEFPKAEGCFEQGLRKNYFHAEPGYRRAIAWLLQQIGGESSENEYPLPFFDRVDPQAAIA